MKDYRLLLLNKMLVLNGHNVSWINDESWLSIFFSENAGELRFIVLEREEVPLQSHTLIQETRCESRFQHQGLAKSKNSEGPDPVWLSILVMRS
jgi:hypothetical protein